jgi:type I restriction enzyme R subunit
LALYQGLVNYEDDILDAYRQFSPDFFDLIIIDECHRGSAADDSKWREILEYFSSATQVGLTATPKETKEISNIEYFGDPIYTYSLKQGIDDGFLAPYKVIRVGLNVDLEGYRPEVGKRDKFGYSVDDRLYNLKDFDRNLVIDDRTKAVAKRVMEFLRKTDLYAKTIVFCVDTEHAERMRQAIANEAGDLVRENYKYVMRITGDEKHGKSELENFINPEERYPVIATTSKLMTTGVDAQTCKLIVLDSNIQSPTEFKQIIGRGTRINEQFDKRFFTIIDFRNVTDQFADRDFNGVPIMVKEIRENEPFSDENLAGNLTEPISDRETGEVLNFGIDAEPVSYTPTIISGGAIVSEVRDKVYVTGVNVEILNERIQYLNEAGDLVTASLKDYTKQNLLRKFSSLDEFLSQWNEADKKSALIAELQAQGIVVEDLQKGIQKDLDLFDLICYVAWGRPPLSRRERAENVRKRDRFAKYGDAVRSVLDALLEKYATDGIENIEELSVLKLEPLKQIGSPKEIVNLFGGKSQYLEVLRELKAELYELAA